MGRGTRADGLLYGTGRPPGRRARPRPALSRHQELLRELRAETSKPALGSEEFNAWARGRLEPHLDQIVEERIEPRAIAEALAHANGHHFYCAEKKSARSLDCYWAACHFIESLARDHDLRLASMTEPLAPLTDADRTKARLDEIDLPLRDGSDYIQPEIVDCLRADAHYCLSRCESGAGMRELADHINRSWRFRSYQSGWCSTLLTEMANTGEIRRDESFLLYAV